MFDNFIVKTTIIAYKLFLWPSYSFSFLLIHKLPNEVAIYSLEEKKNKCLELQRVSEI